MEKLESSYTAAHKMVDLSWKKSLAFSPEFKNIVTICPSYFILGVYPRANINPYKDFYMNLYDLFIIAPRKKPPKYLSVDGMMNNTWCIYKMEYSSSISWNDRGYNIDEHLYHHSEWNKPLTKHHILSNSFHILHELSITRRGKSIEIRSRLIIAMVWGMVVNGKWWLEDTYLCME